MHVGFPAVWLSRGPFKGKYDPGAVFVTSEPNPQQWKVVDVCPERYEQTEGPSTYPSMTSLRMTCSKLNRPRVKVHARVYVQVPSEETTLDNPEQRAQEAMRFEPTELSTLRKLNENPETSKFTPKLIAWEEGIQPDNGHIRGGFHTIVVWEIVPGLQLGTTLLTEDQAFWNLPRVERDRIREKFTSTLDKLIAMKINPEAGSIRNLVWHKEKDMLYWVGFRDWVTLNPCKWTPLWYAWFRLAKPNDDSWARPNWNGDVSRWRF